MLSFSKQSRRKSCRCLSCGEEREEQWGVSKSSRRGIEHRCGRSSSSPKTVPWRIPSPKAFSCRQKHLLRAWPHPTKTRLLCQKEHGRHCFGRMGKPGCQNHTFSSSPHVAVGLPRRSHHIPPKGSPHHPPSSSICASTGHHHCFESMPLARSFFYLRPSLVFHYFISLQLWWDKMKMLINICKEIRFPNKRICFGSWQTPHT